MHRWFLGFLGQVVRVSHRLCVGQHGGARARYHWQGCPCRWCHWRHLRELTSSSCAANATSSICGNSPALPAAAAASGFCGCPPKLGRNQLPMESLIKNTAVLNKRLHKVIYNIPILILLAKSMKQNPWKVMEGLQQLRHLSHVLSLYFLAILHFKSTESIMQSGKASPFLH